MTVETSGLFRETGAVMFTFCIWLALSNKTPWLGFGKTLLFEHNIMAQHNMTT